ncbi:hypothetical protein ACQ4PT_030884 [Festuca glaucescens]
MVDVYSWYFFHALSNKSCAGGGMALTLATLTCTKITPLPLICCTFCHAGQVVWLVSGTTANPGRHIYKCENQGPGGCNFWKWENKYVEYLQERWGRFFMLAPYVVLLDINTHFANNVMNVFRVKVVIDLAISLLSFSCYY